MKSIVSVEIRAPRDAVARLFADPRRNNLWMPDIDRVEPLSGVLGTVGSTYRLVPKEGSRGFVVTIVTRDLPRESRINLQSPTVDVAIRGTLESEAADRTRLTSEEHFMFKGFWNKVLGALARPAISKAHRRSMDAFKQFAEVTLTSSK